MIGLSGMNLLNLFLSSVFLLSAQASDNAKPQLISAPIAAVDIPLLIEARSPVQFEITADFPSSCYSFGPASVRLDGDRNVILFYASAYERQENCLRTPTSLSKIIEVGELPEGTYEVRELKSLKKWGKIQVQHLEASALK